MSRDPDSLAGAFRALDRVASAGTDRRGHHPLRRSLELQPERPEGMFHLGALRLQRNEYAEAEAIFPASCRQRNPMDSDAWKNLGVCLYRQDRAEEALAAGTRADASPRSVTSARDVRRARHLSARHAGILARRFDTLERNLARFPDPAAHYLYAVRCCRSDGCPKAGRSMNSAGCMRRIFRYRVRVIARSGRTGPTGSACSFGADQGFGVSSSTFGMRHA